MTRPVKVGIAFAVLAVVLLAAWLAFGARPLQTRRVQAATTERPTEGQLHDLTDRATSGEAATVASAFAGFTATTIDPLVVASLHRLRNVRSTAIAAGIHGTATVRVTASEGGRTVSDDLVLVKSGGKWLIVTGTK